MNKESGNDMEFKHNPFRFGGDLGSDELVDRAEETAQVEATIRNGEKLFLIGPRRFGKTSILRAADEKLTRSGAIVLRLNAEAFPTVEMLVEKIVTAAAVRLKDRVEARIEKIGKFFSRLKPEFKYGGAGQELSVSIGIDSSALENRPVKPLADALDGLEKLARTQPGSRPVGLILDEFQTVVTRGGDNAEAQIRAAIQEHHRVGYVFAGSQTRLMTEMTMNHDRPFYRLGSNRFIGPLPKAEFSAHLLKQFRRSGFVVANDAPIENILSLAEEVPYNVQMLAHNCWEELRARGRSQPAKLTGALVVHVLRQTVKGLDPLFTQTWTRLTSVQQRALISVIRRQGSGITSTEAARSIGLPVPSVQSALRSLHEQSILRDDSFAGSVRTRFDDPFFAEWIRVTVM
jgi:energy-coupling factor transporter ATP-binding protein EcfA2